MKHTAAPAHSFPVSGSFRRTFFLALEIFALAAGLSLRGEAATFVVTNTLPSGPGSLFDAISACGTNWLVANRITFAIPGAPPHVISPTSSLPDVYGNVSLDGTTQPGFSNATPVVVLDGSLAGTNGVVCIRTIGPSNLIRGLRVQNFSGTGITLVHVPNGNEFNRIEGCHIISNRNYGIDVYPSSNTAIGGFAVSNRNVISGNTYGGILMSYSSGSVIAGNWIGVNPTNSAQAMAGQNSGLWMYRCWSNLVSGTGAASQVFSGNSYAGLLLEQGGHHIVVGNTLGCDAAGLVAVSNQAYGILMQDGASNVIGGISALRNFISGNGQSGVELRGIGHGNQIQGNYIGVSATGISRLPNLRGVLLQAGCSNNSIGGFSGGTGNVISGNIIEGLYMSGSGNRVQGNSIGLGANLSTVVSNGNDGVYVFGANNVIGGTNVGAGNVLSGNGRYGVYVSAGPSNVVQGNLIGIDISGNRRPNESGVNLDFTSGNLIGGTTPAARNVISGNRLVGISIGAGSFGDVLQGNYIGTSISGLSRMSNTMDGIRCSGTNITIGGTVPGAGNVIAGNGDYNIQVFPATKGLNIQGNYIGVGADGITQIAVGSGNSGIILHGSDITVGGTVPGARNVISGNGYDGILVGTASNTVIQGNYIGLGANGTSVVRNGSGTINPSGIFLGSVCQQTTIGGATPDARNVIVGSLYSIRMDGAVNARISGNFLGTTANGNVADTSTVYGISVTNTVGCYIGGTNAGEGNVIYGQQVGIGLYASNTHHNVIQGNLINLNSAGGILSTNILTGISIVQAQSNRIGGATAAARNVIMCGSTGAGVEFYQSNTLGNIVQGNYVGVGPDGVSPRKFSPNAGTGVHAFYAGNNTIGGTNAGEGNVIAHCSYGVVIFNNSAVQNAIFGNTIYSNVWNGSPNVGIDLAPAGGADKTTPNDNVPDSDTGPNNLQNFPVITNAVSLPGSTRVRGYLASASNTKYRIEFFYSDTTNAEGRVYLGATNITTAANGTNAFTAVLNGYAPTSKYITATATDPNNNTSEFCPGVIKPTTAADADNDGIPDFWEGAYGLNFNDPSDATNHLDADGINNRDEYFSGTIPNNSASYLHVAEISIGDINWISFPSSQFRNYNLEAAAAATNNAVWTPILTNILGSGLTITVGDSVDATNQFYRVRSIFP